MSEWPRKIARMEPVIKAKRAIRAKEALILNGLRGERQKLGGELEKVRKAYLSGLEALAELRADPERRGLEIVESSVSFSRDRWMKIFRDVQKLDRQVELQTQALRQAESRLKATEKLMETYQDRHRREMALHEHEVLAELAVVKRHSDE